MSAWLPTAFEPAIEAMITDSITAIYNKSTAATVIATTNRVEAYPTAWSLFPFTG
jgi:hypothetical protein